MFSAHKLAGIYVSSLPVVFAGDLLMIGVMVLGMGIYFENASTIFFGLYDITLGAIFVKNTIKEN